MTRCATTATVIGLLLAGTSPLLVAQEEPSAAAALIFLQQNRLEDCVRYAKLPSVASTQIPSVLYITGICALRANHPFLARAQISRLLALSPKFPGAWFAMAQADYLIRDYAALSKSKMVLATAVLPLEQVVAAKTWLKQLDAASQREIVAIGFNVGFGNTSNASLGTTEADYLGTPIPLVARSVASNFGSASLRVTAAKAVGLFSQFIGMAEISKTNYSRTAYLNQQVLSASLAFQRPISTWTTEFAARGFIERVSGTQRRTFGTLDFTAVRRESDHWEVILVGRAGRLNYGIKERPDLDTWRLLWNGNVVRLFGGSLENQIGLGLFGGGDEEVIDRSSYGNSRIGMRAFSRVKLNAQFALEDEATYSIARFDVHGGFFGTTRQDTQASLAFGANWKRHESSKWSVAARYIHRMLHSNVSVYSFDQNQLGLYVSYNSN